jgi:hypothetical protein
LIVESYALNSSFDFAKLGMKLLWFCRIGDESVVAKIGRRKHEQRGRRINKRRGRGEQRRGRKKRTKGNEFFYFYFNF